MYLFPEEGGVTVRLAMVPPAATLLKPFLRAFLNRNLCTNHWRTYATIAAAAGTENFLCHRIDCN